MEAGLNIGPVTRPEWSLGVLQIKHLSTSQGIFRCAADVVQLELVQL